MRESFHLGRVAGVSVGLNWTLLPVAALFTWSLATGQLPYEVHGYSSSAYWVTALLTTILFFAGLLAHELSHAVVARRGGIHTRGIVLWLLGGVAQLDSDSTDPGTEFKVAVAGPAMSLTIALVAGLGAWGLSALGLSPLIVAAVVWLAGINALLGVFNLLPAFPLDGGRVLRAALWWRWRDQARATAAVARTARFIGAGLVGLGLVEFLSTGSLGGTWLALIGWFVMTSARQQERRVAVGSRLADIRVADAMSVPPVVVPVSATLADVLNQYLRVHRFTTYPVVDETGRIVGLTTTSRMNRVPGERWWMTPVTAASATPAEMVVCSPVDPLGPVSDRLAASPDGIAVVIDQGRLVGMLSASDVEGALRRADLLRRLVDNRVGNSVDHRPEDPVGRRV